MTKRKQIVYWTVFPDQWANIIAILIFLLVLVADDHKRDFLWEGKFARVQNSGYTEYIKEFNNRVGGGD